MRSEKQKIYPKGLEKVHESKTLSLPRNKFIITFTHEAFQ